MSERALVSTELAHLLGVLAHRDRVRIVEELRGHERDVNTLQELLEISHSRASQHLSLLRSNRLVLERREGRHVYYRLAQPELAGWLLEGLKFLAGEATRSSELYRAVDRARHLWSEEPPAGAGSPPDPD
jgi:DNA-binding transcriptional ArsR family regulator